MALVLSKESVVEIEVCKSQLEPCFKIIMFVYLKIDLGKKLAMFFVFKRVTCVHSPYGSI